MTVLSTRWPFDNCIKSWILHFKKSWKFVKLCLHSHSRTFVYICQLISAICLHLSACHFDEIFHRKIQKLTPSSGNFRYYWNWNYSSLIDTRVATLRCFSVSLESIQNALNQWNLTNVNRLEINRMASSKKIDRLRSISDDTTMLKLSEIFLVNSGLEELGERSLDGFDFNGLESIDLSWNELTQVPQVVLKLGKLRHLDLSHNKIFSLPPGSSFNNLNALATLKLSGNK